MLKRMLYMWMFGTLLTSSLYAQDVTGDWQGSLGVGPQQLRLILRIAKRDDSGWKATLYSIDQTPDWGAGMPVSSVSIQGTEMKFTVGLIGGAYEGKLSEDIL